MLFVLFMCCLQLGAISATADAGLYDSQEDFVRAASYPADYGVGYRGRRLLKIFSFLSRATRPISHYVSLSVGRSVGRSVCLSHIFWGGIFEHFEGRKA